MGYMYLFLIDKDKFILDFFKMFFWKFIFDFLKCFS